MLLKISDLLLPLLVVLIVTSPHHGQGLFRLDQAGTAPVTGSGVCLVRWHRGFPCSQTLLELLGGAFLVYSNRIGGSISAGTLAVRVVLQVGDGRDVSVGGKEGGRLVGVDAEDVPADARA